MTQALEVLVNGQSLIQSDQVDPYSPDTTDAPITLHVPDAQISTGSLVIAIRSHRSRFQESPAFGELETGQSAAACLSLHSFVVAVEESGQIANCK